MSVAYYDSLGPHTDSPKETPITSVKIPNELFPRLNGMIDITEIEVPISNNV